MTRIAVVLGATGLVGKAVTGELLTGDWDEVRVLVRRPLELQHPKLKQTSIDWEKLGQYKEQFSGAYAVFCCLGTTIKKQAHRSNLNVWICSIRLRPLQLPKNAV